MTCCNIGLYNVIITGVAFMLIFTAFQTGAMIQERVLEAVTNETAHTDHPFKGDGYTSLSVIYLVFAFANWIAAPIVAVIGPRIGMFVGGIVYSGFIASFLWPQTWLLYVMSALLGIAAAIIWTAQGNFLTLNSTKETMGRNSGIFWAIFQSSLLFGNLFVHYQLRGTDIPKTTRYIVYGALTGTGVLGTILIVLMRKPPDSDEAAVNSDFGAVDQPTSPWRKMVDELKLAMRMFITKDMLLLFVGFFYTGLELTFFSGVYGTCITHTGAFGSEADSLIGFSGMLIGGGEIIGGLLFGILGYKTNKYGRDLIVILGFVVHMVSFFLIFINLPDRTTIEITHESAYITSSQGLALFCSFMLGFGDSCFNTQIYSLLGVRYSDESGAAFALFKFSQSFSAAVAFFYSSHLVMKWQLLILVITGIAGTLCIANVEWGLQKKASHYTRLEPDET